MNQLKVAHRHSSKHRTEVLTSPVCGCFYCLKIFVPDEIREWIDGRQTALCPYCGIDSVLPANAGFPITSDFLYELQRYYFGG